jgi:hypothetical protein
VQSYGKKNNITFNQFQIFLYGSFYMHDAFTFVGYILGMNFTQCIAMGYAFLGFLFEFLSVGE